MIYAIQKATMRVLHRDSFGNRAPLSIPSAFARTVLTEQRQGYNATDLISAICALLADSITAMRQHAIRMDLLTLTCEAQAQAVRDSLDTPDDLAYWAKENKVSASWEMRRCLADCRESLARERARLAEIYNLSLADLLAEYDLLIGGI